MVDKAYISNIAPGWSVKRQEEVLAERVDGWPVEIYRDELKPRHLKKRDVAMLEERATLLRPTGRKVGSVLHVANLAVLAWNVSDFQKVVDGLADRRVRLVAHSEGHVFDFTISENRQTAIATFPESRKRGSREKSRIMGAQVSADRRNAISKAAADRVRGRWGAEGYTQAALVAEAGMNVRTIVRWLGKWGDAKRRLERNAKRAAQKAALEQRV